MRTRYRAVGVAVAALLLLGMVGDTMPGRYLPSDYFGKNPLDPSDPSSALSLAQSLGATDRAARNIDVRLGRVISYNGAQVKVTVSGSAILDTASYLINYKPAVGDIVSLLRFGASWLILGPTMANPADNVVKNYSFEESKNGDPPAHWVYYHDPLFSDQATSFTTNSLSPGQALDGVQFGWDSMPGTGGTGAEDYLSSDPIAVVPGEIWSASAWAFGQAANYDAFIAAGVSLTWYANATDTYPNTSAPDSLVDLVALSPTNDWKRLQTSDSDIGVQVPSGASFMRVTLIVEMFAGANNGEVDVGFDRVIAQKIYNADGTLFNFGG